VATVVVVEMLLGYSGDEGRRSVAEFDLVGAGFIEGWGY